MTLREIATLFQRLAAEYPDEELYTNADPHAEPVTVERRTRTDGEVVVSFYVDGRLELAVATRKERV